MGKNSLKSGQVAQEPHSKSVGKIAAKPGKIKNAAVASLSSDVLAARQEAASEPASSAQIEAKKTPSNSNAVKNDPPSPQGIVPPQTMADLETLSHNAMRVMDESGRILAQVVRPQEQGRGPNPVADEMSDAVKTLGSVAEYWMADPGRSAAAQSVLASNMLGLWSNTLRRLSGDETKPVIPSDPSDRRFSGPDWGNPMFDFMRQAHAMTMNWAGDLIARTPDIDAHTRDKANFYVRQISSATSPANFLATNPELIRETLAQKGENLLRGVHQLAEDIEAGHGSLKIRQSDNSQFKIGINMAMTPGKVVYRNELIELIQYAPTTDQVYRRPLLIVPPWINKFYVLDLNPEKSFIRWAVSEGLTVFVISWVNPDARHRDKSFEDYMREGILAALDAIEAATGEKKVTAIGYCVGGTLLSATLAYMAAKKDQRIESATLFTTQVDFTDPGDLKVFVDEEQVAGLEAQMAEKGYLEGSKMANAFNMLRPNDLIWSHVVNNYTRGLPPRAFDLLAWNADTTRMPASNHSYYLRNCYLDNNFSKGRMELGGVTLDLGQITIPIYNLAAREDHIAPAKSVFAGAKLFGGPMRYVLSGSGHIAGVVNPVGKAKYQYWLGSSPSEAGTFDAWLAGASEHKGTWWPDWMSWIAGQAPKKVKARTPGEGKLQPICDAPGEYVLVQA